jgi:protease II
MPDSPLPTPPVARKEPRRIEQLGRVRTDDYAWMKDDNWQQVLRDPQTLRADVREHLEAENAYTKAMLASTEALQAQMFAGEGCQRTRRDVLALQLKAGELAFHAKFLQLPKCRRIDEDDHVKCFLCWSGAKVRDCLLVGKPCVHAPLENRPYRIEA